MGVLYRLAMVMLLFGSISIVRTSFETCGCDVVILESKTRKLSASCERYAKNFLCHCELVDSNGYGFGCGINVGIDGVFRRPVHNGKSRHGNIGGDGPAIGLVELPQSCWFRFRQTPKRPWT